MVSPYQAQIRIPGGSFSGALLMKHSCNENRESTTAKKKSVITTCRGLTKFLLSRKRRKRKPTDQDSSVSTHSVL